MLQLPNIPLKIDEVDVEKPVPASKIIPEWYKKLDSYVGGEKKPLGDGARAPSTIKKCMPFFDAMSAGYKILSPCDVYVRQKDGQPEFEWTAFNMIKFHPIVQAPSLPQNKVHGVAIPKWNNPWSIKTPRGYSVLVIHPFNHDLPFTILPGIIDTDTFNVPIAFPFTLNEPNFEGMIPAGTPIAQIIPFKRESWEMKFGNQEDVKIILRQGTKLLARFFDAYKTVFRQTKQYK